MSNQQDVLTMPHDQLEALQLEGVKKTLITCYEKVPFYKERFDEAGFDPYAVNTLDDLAKAPFVTKQDLRDNYPYKLFAVPLSEVKEIHMSSGTTGVATVGGYTEKDLDIWGDCFARSIEYANGGPDDICHVCYGYGLFTGGLGAHYGSLKAGTDASKAIMTTDTKKKEVAVEFELGGVTCRMGGMAKGSGMIHPNMATMLVFITTDAAIAPHMLQKALSTDVQDTFNMTSVDGDTSTNDMVSVMANGLAGNPEITEKGPDFSEFMKALNTITVQLCRMIAGDGEGATKLLECKVSGAKDIANAKKIAKSVICSSLTKAAMFGADANWGRVLCAMGYSGAEVDIDKVNLSFKSKAGEIAVCENGAGIEFSEDKAKEILLEDEIEIVICLGDGDASATAWGCDLTYDYVKINGDYRT